MSCRRAGSTLIIVLAMALLVSVQLYILFSFSSASFRQTEKVMAHVRAIYVGESAFAKVLARLKGGPWQDRWFKDGPFEERNVELLGGRYSMYLADGSTDPSRKLADVWVEARYEGSLAVMYWQVLYVDDTLDFTAQVYPRFFTHLEAHDPTPLNGAPGPATTLIQNAMDTQRTNRPRAVDIARRLDPIDEFAGVVATLGIPPPADRGLDAKETPVGSPLPNADYLERGRQALPRLPGTLTPPALPVAPPLPTPPPTPTVVPTPTPAPTVVSTPTPAPTTTTTPQAEIRAISDPQVMAGLIFALRDSPGDGESYDGMNVDDFADEAFDSRQRQSGRPTAADWARAQQLVDTAMSQGFDPKNGGAWVQGRPK